MATTKTNHYFKKLTILLATMATGLVLTSGVALAVNKVCPTGTTQQNPCSGTTGIDTLIGTIGPDYIKGLAGNDKISGGAGDDTTDGGGGNDTYSYKNGWGLDTLIDSGGSADHLNFSALGSDAGGVVTHLYPEIGVNELHGSTSAERVTLSASTAVIEKVTGSSGYDYINTGQAANTLRPGPGTGGASIVDWGGCSTCTPAHAASSDTYTGFAASGYGPVTVRDFGGAADKLVLPFASTDVYFEAKNGDSDAAADNLLIMSSGTDYVSIRGQLEPENQQQGHIEQIQFTDETISIGSETPQAQTISGAKTAGGAEAQVAALNKASNLDEAEKAKRSEAAKKAIEAKQHEKEQKGSHGQQPPDGQR